MTVTTAARRDTVDQAGRVTLRHNGRSKVEIRSRQLLMASADWVGDTIRRALAAPIPPCEMGSAHLTQSQ